MLNLNFISSQNLSDLIDDDVLVGNRNAPLTLIEFGDYQDPFSQRFDEQTYPLIKKDYIESGKINYVFRDFPLNFHPQAQKAAEGAQCAGDIGGDEKYFEMHNKILENQESLSVDNIKKLAKDIGLDQNEFDDCLDSGKMANEVAKDMADGESYDVFGTPTFFILNNYNGNISRLNGAYPYREFKEIFNDELSSIDSKKPRISKILPNRGFTNGSNFYIRYSEENLKEITLSWNPNVTKITCPSGKNNECYFNVDLSSFDGQEISYTFTIKDFGGNENSKTINKIKVDTTFPIINNPYSFYIVDENYIYFDFNISENNLDEVSYFFIDARGKERDRKICSKLNENGKCIKKIFLRGKNPIKIRIIDKAGNFVDINLY